MSNGEVIARVEIECVIRRVSDTDPVTGVPTSRYEVEQTMRPVRKHHIPLPATVVGLAVHT